MEEKAVHADALQTQAGPASLVEDAHASRIRNPDLRPAFRVTRLRLTTLARLRPLKRSTDHRPEFGSSLREDGCVSFRDL
jgi:hypothetical protein